MTLLRERPRALALCVPRPRQQSASRQRGGGPGYRRRRRGRRMFTLSYGEATFPPSGGLRGVGLDPRAQSADHIGDGGGRRAIEEVCRTMSGPLRYQGSGRTRPRLLVWFVLLAVWTVVGVVAAPGTAMAAAPTVTPLFDCYVVNGDTSMTVVLGYTSTYPNQVSIPLTNKKNYAQPGGYSSQLPTRFQAGTHHGVATLHVAAADLGSLSWHLDGTTLNFTGTPGGVSKCSPTQLPALADGAVLTLVFVLAGASGVFVLRRMHGRGSASGDLPVVGQGSDVRRG